MVTFHLKARLTNCQLNEFLWNIKTKKGNDSKAVIPLCNNMNPRNLECTVRSGNNTLYINAWRTGTLREHLSDRISFSLSDEDHVSKDLLA